MFTKAAVRRAGTRTHVLARVFVGPVYGKGVAEGEVRVVMQALLLSSVGEINCGSVAVGP